MEITLTDPGTVTVLVLLISIPLSLWVLRRTTTSEFSNDGTADIPNAVGGVPLLGNALQYKNDPIGCVLHQQTALNSKLFRINLAGREMIIVGSDRKAMKQIATQPSHILSARKAVANIGFEYTLGPTNVYRGTDWHKRILKQELMSGNKFDTQFLPNVFQALERAIEHELQQQANHNGKGGDENEFVRMPDLFAFVRRCILRSQIDSLLSPVFLEEDPNLLEEFMKFQDLIEETTAKAAVLPRWLALPVCLWPTQSARNKVVQRLSPLIRAAWKKNETSEGNATNEASCLGPWMKTYLEEQTPAEEAAELIVGLLFASHKNPSIGAAQCFCFAKSNLDLEQQQHARREADAICDYFRQKFLNSVAPVNPGMQVLVKADTLRRCVLETMRLTAHTIGAVRYAEHSIQVEMEHPTSGMAAENNNRNDRPVTVTTYGIRRGETVAIAHHAMHIDTCVWGSNAADFSLDRPEWKLDEDAHAELGIPVDPYKFTTFSNGLHQCPGAKIALSMMEIVLALLLVRDAQLVGSLPNLTFERATLAQRKGPVLIKIRKVEMYA